MILVSDFEKTKSRIEKVICKVLSMHNSVRINWAVCNFISWYRLMVAAVLSSKQNESSKSVLFSSMITKIGKTG